jgi:hypothetical protein
MNLHLSRFIFWVLFLQLASLSSVFGNIGVGSRVRVNSSNGVNVRSTPAGTSLGAQPFGATGTAVGGPQNALFGGVNHTWWNVNFDSGMQGWVSSNGSAIVAVSNPAPSVSSVSPNSVVGSTSARTFTIYGSNFVSGCRVQAAWGNNGFTYQDVSSTPVFTNSGQISVSINTATTPDTWRLRVRNPDGQTSSGFVTFAVTAPATPPNAPTNLEAQAFPDRVSLGWSDNSSNETGFRIERRIGSGSWVVLTNTGANSSNSAFYNDNSTQPRTTYSYRIIAFNNHGTSNASNTVTLTTPAGKPGSFTLSNDPPVWDATLARPKVNLRWNASTDAGNYAVHRVGATPQAGISGLSFTDSSGTVAGATYNYFVRASNAAGTTDSNTITVTMPNAPLVAPNAPTNLEAQAFPDRVSLGWSDNSSNETGFRIERRIGSGSWVVLTNTSANSSNSAFYNDNSAQPRTSYSYRIFAFNNQGTSNASNIVTLTTPAGRPGPFTLSNDPPVWDAALARPKVNLRWTASADVGGYAVHRVGATPQAGISARSFTDSTGTVAGTTYSYFIRASNAAGSTDSNTVTVTMPNAPVLPLPDFVVSSLSINPATAAPGASVTVNVTIRNNGNGPAPAGSLCRIRLASATTITTSDPLLDEFTVGALNANGGQQSFTRTVVIPSSTIVGSRFIGATANASSAGPTESNGTNNQATTPISIQWSSSTAPQIASVTPNPIVADAANAFQTLTIDGSNFVDKPTVILTWSRQSGHTLSASRVTFISNSRILISIQLGRIGDVWSVSLINPNGQSSSSRSFTVQAPQSSAPGAFTLSNETPTNLSTGPAVRLNWGESSGATSYTVLRDGQIYFPGLAGTSRTFNNTANLTAGRTYTYQIRAFNSGGSRDSNTIQVTIPNALPQPPGTFVLRNDPPIWNAQNMAPSVQLQWDASPGAGPMSYEVYRNNQKIFPASTTPYTGTTFNNTAGLVSGLNYSYHVVAINSLGQRSSNTLQIRMPQPPAAAPQPFTLSTDAPFWDTKVNRPAVRLNWEPSTHATQYEVWRNGARVFPTSGSLTATTWLDNSQAANTSPRYTILARNSLGSIQSNEKTVQLPSSNSGAANPPGLFVGRAEFSGWDPLSSNAMVTLFWSDSEAAEFYQVLRSGALLHNAGKETSHLIRSGLTPGRIHSFQVRALNSMGNTLTPTFSVWIPSRPVGQLPTFEITHASPTLQSGAAQLPAVRLIWSAVAGATHYDVFRDDGRILASQRSIGANVTSGMSHGATYTFQVIASGPGGTVASNRLPVTMPNPTRAAPSAPVLRNDAPFWQEGASPGPGVKLTWSRPTNTATFNLLRNNEILHRGLTGSSITDTSRLVQGAVYTYQVVAINAGGPTPSNTLTIQMPDGPSGTGGSLPLAHGVRSGLASGQAGTRLRYHFQVPSGAAKLTVRSRVGGGDVDLYMQRGSSPRVGSNAPWSATGPFGNETLTVNSPISGTYHLLVQGKLPFENLSVQWEVEVGDGRLPAPVFSHPSGTYSINTPITLSENSGNSNAQIRYTLDGSEPQATSGYTFMPGNPIRLFTDQTIRARVVVRSTSGTSLSPIETRSYIVTGSPSEWSSTDVEGGKQWEAAVRITGKRTLRFSIPNDVIAPGLSSVQGIAGVEIVVATPRTSKGKVTAIVSRSDPGFGRVRETLPVVNKINSLPLWVHTNPRFSLFTAEHARSHSLAGDWEIELTAENNSTQDCEVSVFAVPVQLSNRANGNPILANRNTWIVSHGRTDKAQANGMQRLGLAILGNVEAAPVSGQVLMLNWSAGSFSNFRQKGLQGTRFIRPVALKARHMAERLGLQPNQTNWVGHSWGALVGYQFGVNHSEYPNTIIPPRILNSYVALDPAANGAPFIETSTSRILGDVYFDHDAVLSKVTGRNGRTLSLVGIDESLLMNISGSKKKASSTDLGIIVRFHTGLIPNTVGDLATLISSGIHSGVHRVYTVLLEASSAPTAMIRPTNIATLTGPTFYWRPNQFNGNGKHQNNSLFDGVIDVSLQTLSSGSVTHFQYVPLNQAQPAIYNIGRSFREP